jgi:FO synthase
MAAAERWLHASASELMLTAVRLRDTAHGNVVSYSRKVFIPLTRLCRDVCSYCTFARAPQAGVRSYLTPDDVRDIAKAGQAAGCTEALFTLGDKPELRYKAAREELATLGYASTIDYLHAMCALVLKETSLLPHVNSGVMTRDEISRLREVSASQGLMLESTAECLCEKGGPHFGSPDKHPAVRLATLRLAGELKIPFTTGILIGIGETRQERVDALLAIRELHQQYGHIQEVIIQNFRAKPDTRMAQVPHASHEELLWTIAVARLMLGAEMNLQAPPNLSGAHCTELLDAGINDWGGVSSVTPDHVNPEAPWPAIDELRRVTASRGKTLVARLPSYPTYVHDAARWHVPDIATRLIRASDSEGYARDHAWSPGLVAPLKPTELPPLRAQRAGEGWGGGDQEPPLAVARPHPNLPPQAGEGGVLAPRKGNSEIKNYSIKTNAYNATTEAGITRLFAARGGEFDDICAAADELRRQAVGDTVRYVVNRNINYTNICAYRCTFCAFSKGRHSASLRGAPYDLSLEEISRCVAEAWSRGATEVCMQGGIHPSYNGDTYLGILRAVKRAAPAIHVHAFTPLEVTHGAQTLGLPVREFLSRLIAAGLNSLPGTAAEILDDDVRRVICPDKVTTREWLDVMQTAHELGLRSTATIMFGHVEQPRHWARHLLRIRALQEKTGGFTEFIPLPFVHMGAPVYQQGHARKGPTAREAILMHAVARLVLHPVIKNIQVSWVKMGEQGVGACLTAGANDLGGTLMNESISRAAGTQHGQEMLPARMEGLIRAVGRVPLQRTTLYGDATQERRDVANSAAPLVAGDRQRAAA